MVLMRIYLELTRQIVPLRNNCENTSRSHDPLFNIATGNTVPYLSSLVQVRFYMHTARRPKELRKKPEVFHWSSGTSSYLNIRADPPAILETLI